MKNPNEVFLTKNTKILIVGLGMIGGKLCRRFKRRRLRNGAPSIPTKQRYLTRNNAAGYGTEELLRTEILLKNIV